MTKYASQHPVIQKHRARIGITNASNFGSRITLYADATRRTVLFRTWKWNKDVVRTLCALIGEPYTEN